MISVCLATYGSSEYLLAQIDSILSQIHDDDELIISDDNENDNVLKILPKDQRIRYIRNKGRHGVNNNFQNALTEAKGDIIFLSDQDDVWFSDKVENCMRELETCDCIMHDAVVTDSNLNVIHPSFYKIRNSAPGLIRNIYKNSYLGCCMAFKKEMLKDILPIPDTKSFFHDGWIGSIADASYHVRFADFKGIYFRRHAVTTSTTAGRSKLSLINKLYNRLYHIFLLTKRLIFHK